MVQWYFVVMVNMVHLIRDIMSSMYRADMALLKFMALCSSMATDTILTADYSSNDNTRKVLSVNIAFPMVPRRQAYNS